MGHVGSLIVLDPSTAPGGAGTSTTVRAVFEPRLHLAAPLRQRLVEVPLGLGRPYWVDDPHFDIEFHLRELALPAPGHPRAARRAGGPDPRAAARPHAGRCGRPTSSPASRAAGRVLLEDPPRRDRRRLRRRDPRDDHGPHRRAPEVDAARTHRSSRGAMPSTVDLVRRGVRQMARQPGRDAAHRPQVAAVRRPAARRRELPRHPAAQPAPPAPSAGCWASRAGRPDPRDLKRARAPRSTAPSPRTGGSRSGRCRSTDVKTVKNHFGMTVNDVVMALTAAALRRWLLDHDALPEHAAGRGGPVSIRAEDQRARSATRSR